MRKNYVKLIVLASLTSIVLSACAKETNTVNKDGVPKATQLSSIPKTLNKSLGDNLKVDAEVIIPESIKDLKANVLLVQENIVEPQKAYDIFFKNESLKETNKFNNPGWRNKTYNIVQYISKDGKMLKAGDNTLSYSAPLSAYINNAFTLDPVSLFLMQTNTAVLAICLLKPEKLR